MVGGSNNANNNDTHQENVYRTMLPNLSALRVDDGRSADVDAGTFPSVTDKDTKDVTGKILEFLVQGGTMHMRLCLRYVAQKWIVLSLRGLPADSATYAREVKHPTYTWPPVWMGRALSSHVLKLAIASTPRSQHYDQSHAKS